MSSTHLRLISRITILLLDIAPHNIGRVVRQKLARIVGLRLIPVRPKFNKEARLLAKRPASKLGRCICHAKRPGSAST